MAASLLQIVESTSLAAEEIEARTQRIRDAVLNASQYLDRGNFTCIHPDDSAALFAQYDDLFFNRQIKGILGDTPLEFGLSKRMTRSGGKTTRYRSRSEPHDIRFEICIATSLLFQCFKGDDHRPISVSGIDCRDRLDALQRVMEHEITHLIEMLLWVKSSCNQPRFHSITLRFFGHTHNRHRLITPPERAMARFGIAPGAIVRFDFEGVRHTGVVNRVTKRATVLVEDDRGEKYTNGKRYTKFYVPVNLLQPVQDDRG